MKFLSRLVNTSCSDVITVPLFFSLPPKPPPPPHGNSCKMAARNAKRPMSTILRKNRGLWTVYHVPWRVLSRIFQCLLRRKSDSSVDGDSPSGSHRAIRGGIQIPETWLDALRPFSRAAARTPRRACSQASWGITQILPPTVRKKHRVKWSFSFSALLGSESIIIIRHLGVI